MSKLVIKGGTCVTAEARLRQDVLVENGVIVALDQDIQIVDAEIIDANGLFVLPGGVDVHVHLPWPKGQYISLDDINQGTKAAAFGGVTTIIDFVIPDEQEPLADALERKLNEAQNNAWVDYSFHLNIRGAVDKKIAEIPEMVTLGFPSFKVFMAYEGFRIEDVELLNIMQAVQAAGGMLDVHAENGLIADRITAQLIEKGRIAPTYYAMARPEICETEAIQRVLAYAQVYGTRIHIHHVSTAAGAELIGRSRQKGMPVTGETCPHYLLLNADSHGGDQQMAAFMICAPSIKGSENQEALWHSLADDSLSILATDHCPYSKQQKLENLGNFSTIPGGIGGVELRLPLIFSEGVRKGRLSFERFVNLWATAPAKTFGLYPRKGQIAIGSDADLVLFDSAQNWTIRAESLHMNTDCLPYEGWQIIGKPVMTILRGKVLVGQNQLVCDKPDGQLIRRFLGAQ
ncbi:MAG: dihydropyrimidinase [Anaerolineales bacterium]